eukprot:TRINITY_DN56612_c0_g1_i1.p1 TRINITY_DN56612_c0_g1~~TRINITY_DN56612_c0_g1_i1.p1  ORF type:complete len:400 (+),score=39.30 TRINITY_DN56612_c0_g1_i1:58-1257(+)
MAGPGKATQPTERTVFVGGIDQTITEEMLRVYCEREFGPVEAIQVIADPCNGKRRGFAFVHFVNVEIARAVKSRGTILFYDRELNVGDAVLTDRRHRMCKFYFDHGRCLNPHCVFSHSLQNLQQAADQMVAPQPKSTTTSIEALSPELERRQKKILNTESLIAQIRMVDWERKAGILPEFPEEADDRNSDHDDAASYHSQSSYESQPCSSGSSSNPNTPPPPYCSPEMAWSSVPPAQSPPVSQRKVAATPSSGPVLRPDPMPIRIGTAPPVPRPCSSDFHNGNPLAPGSVSKQAQEAARVVRVKDVRGVPCLVVPFPDMIGNPLLEALYRVLVLQPVPQSPSVSPPPAHGFTPKVSFNFDYDADSCLPSVVKDSQVAPCAGQFPVPFAHVNPAFVQGKK